MARLRLPSTSGEPIASSRNGTPTPRKARLIGAPNSIGGSSSPITNSGSATTSPASGPLIPTSNSDRRVLSALRMKITAPSVPRLPGIGSGMKNGSVTLTRWRRAAT